MGDDSMRPAATTAINQCLDLGADEHCLVVTDDDREPIGDILYDVANDVGEASIIRYPPGDTHGGEPPATVAAAMESADAFLAPTSKSLSHTRARSTATDAGVRGATLPGITESVFTTGLAADYDAIAAACQDLYDQLAGTDTIRITSPQGTDLTVEPGDRPWEQDTGDITEPGSFSNLPAGEVFVAPETGSGTYVVDGTMMPHGRLDEPLTFDVEDGTITHISDDAIRGMVDDAAADVGDAAYNLAELGVGANVGVTELVGSVLLDEKAGGTVHIAIGDNASIGGDTEAPVHLDGILRNPTVYADGTEVTLPTPS